MVNFTFVLTLLCTFSWICVPFCDFNTAEVQPGEEVTLQCCNLSGSISHIFWFKLANGHNISRISSMTSSESSASINDGFDHNKFNMTSNTTNIFLNIKQVDFSDSGVYFCGLYLTEAHRIFSATYLKVEDGFDGLPELPIGILSSIVIVVVMVIIALVVKIRTTGQSETQNQHNENLDSDSLNYAALSFRPTRRPVPTSELDQHAVYTATRQSQTINVTT